MPSGLVYLVQPNDCLGSDQYKIGMSNSPTIARLKSYGSGCAIITIRGCNNPAFVESKLIQMFKKNFGPAYQGNEWFKGPQLALANTFDKCFAQHAVVGEDNDRVEPIRSSFVLEVFIESHLELVRYLKEEEVVAPDPKTLELISFFNRDLITSEGFLRKLISAIRGIDLPDTVKRVTAKALLTSTGLLGTLYTEIKIMNEFTRDMNSIENRMKRSTLVKIAKSINPAGFKEWKMRWESRPSQSKLPKKSIVYKEGSELKLSELQAFYPSKLTLTVLQKIDPRIKIKRKNACRSCHKRHLKGCCDSYERLNNSKASFAINAALQ